MSSIIAVKQKLIDLIKEAAEKAQAEGRLPAVSLPDIQVEHPQNPEHGDYATSLPLRLARATGLKPLDIAQAIASFIPESEEVISAVAAPPGFINFTLKDSWLSSRVEEILSAAASYGNIEMGRGTRVQIEFVSANPTGPLHVGNGRGAVLGSTLANVLEAAAYSVQREFYVNDAGSQIDTFKRTLLARYKQALNIDARMPEDGYHGEYMVELGRQIAEQEGERFLDMPEEMALDAIGQIGLCEMINQMKADLELLGVSFDEWYSESSLFDKGQYQTAMALLEEGGYLAEKEGATWFVSTALGENKDNVVVRSDGTPTYFASDIAYHYDKFSERGFERVIDIWGADHQGHVSRMKAVVSALGISPEQLEVIIYQMVSLRRGGEAVRLSKRTGDIITLREVIEEVGADACRFFFLTRSADGQMDFDLELAKKESAENPVYYVQYAHARIASILELAAEKGLRYEGGDVSRLTTEPELSLIRQMLLLPEIIELAARNLEPHHLPHYAQELATAFHSFYTRCRVVDGKDEATSKARLKLVAAAKLTLSRTLTLMGMTAPEKM